MGQYAPALSQAGVELTLHPLLDDAYLLQKYEHGSTPWPRVARSYASRAAELPSALRAADVLWVEKELWPWAPAWLERLILARRPWIMDIDDAIFHLYDQHRLPLVRVLWGRKIDALMRAAHMVTCGNEYLSQRARQAGARRVEILPTVVDLARYRPAAPAMAATAQRPIAIAWIGSPSTVHYLQALAEPLARLSSSHAVELHVIGAQIRLNGVKVVHVPWTEASEVSAIAACDIGVMPLVDSPWERGKCGYKLIQYMACGLPVVGSPVGVNREIVTDELTGYLASTPIQWEEALRRLVIDSTLRARMGAAGRQRVEARYSLQGCAPAVARWLLQAAGTAGSPKASAS
jgi:glycosyltransferase involved in cell wall biosynthesis